MRIRALLLALVVGVLNAFVPTSANAADAPQAPAGPEFNQVQLKVVADNDFAVFMGNDLEASRLFYQNDVEWGSQISNIQTLNLYPVNGETYVYIVPMGGNSSYQEPGDENPGEENWSGVLNNIALVDYPGAEVAVGRRVGDDRDIIHTGYLLINNYLTDYVGNQDPVARGEYNVVSTDVYRASQNLIWSPATRDYLATDGVTMIDGSPIIPDPITSCTVACDGSLFEPPIPNGAWDMPDASAVLFRYPLSNANLPVSPGDRQVTVTWKEPTSGGAVANYLIEYKESSETDAAYKTFATVAGTATSSTVTGLTNGTPYTLRVTAINAGGSAASEGRAVVPTGTPSSPSNQSYGAGDGSVEINFNPPENDGGMAVTNYSYSLDNGVNWITRSPVSTSSPLTISGLTNGTIYPVKLRAINPFGAGTHSLAISVKPGIVATRTLTYSAGTLAPIQGLASGATYIPGDQFTVAAGPTRPSFTFSGWKDGAVAYTPGSTYTVGSGNPNLTAQWTQDSFLGTTAEDRSRVLTWNISAGVGIDTTVSGGVNNSIRVQIPANALEPGTEVIFWRLLSDTVAKAKISGSNSYFVNLAVTWSLGDDVNTPKTVQVATSPIILTITNNSIVQGATAWQIIGDSVRVIGQAEENGKLVLRFTEDPIITAANVAPIPAFGTPTQTANGYQVAITNYDETYSWEAPTVSSGTVSVISTVGSTRTLAVSGLTAGQTATITQRNLFNGVYQTGTFTGAAIAAPISDTGAEVAPTPTPPIAPAPTTTPAPPVAKSLVVTGFNPGSWALTKNIKRAIDNFFKSVAKPKQISCLGQTMGPSVLKVDQRLALRRGQEVCLYVASKNPSITKFTTQGSTTKISSSKYRRTLIKLTY
jgi:hypothetical protein